MRFISFLILIAYIGLTMAGVLSLVYYLNSRVLYGLNRILLSYFSMTLIILCVDERVYTEGFEVVLVSSFILTLWHILIATVASGILAITIHAKEDNVWLHRGVMFVVCSFLITIVIRNSYILEVLLH